MQRLNELDTKDIRIGMGLCYESGPSSRTYWVITGLSYDEYRDKYFINIKRAGKEGSYTIEYIAHPKNIYRYWYIFDIP